jgi:hypothetical protein
MHKSYRRALLALSINLVIVFFTGTTQLIFTSSVHGAAGDLFVSDSVTNSILAYAPDGTVRTFATGLDNPQGLTFDTLGNLYAADRGSGNVYKFSADGTRTTFISGLLGPVGLSFAGTVLLVAEHDGDQVSLISPDGTFGTPRVVPGPLGVGFDNLSKDPNAPDPTTWVPSNSDPATSFVEEFKSDGTIALFLAGLDPRAIAFSTLPFNGPFDNVFISSGSGTIYGISIPDETVSPFITGLGDLNGLAFRPARFSGDTEAGDLFAADTAGGNIYEITPDKTQTTFASDSHPNYLVFEPHLFGKLVNISTRLDTLTGDDVLIGGFIITGTDSRQVVLRGIGPSLSNATPPVAGALADPVLELHLPDGTVLTNDNWMDNSAEDQMTITDNGLDQYNGMQISDLESAIVATLPPGPYTVILRGTNDGTGVAMVEAYDLNPTMDGEAGNISSRGFVSTADNVMIAGFMIDPRVDQAARVLVRAIGPTLADSGVASPLQDPFLELHDASGAMISSNDNWADTAETEIQNTGIPPTDDRESAILANLPAGEYTAIVSSATGDTGVALVEVYHLP